MEVAEFRDGKTQSRISTAVVESSGEEYAGLGCIMEQAMDRDSVGERTIEEASDEDTNQARMAMLAIWGMQGTECVMQMRKRLLELEGVVSAVIDLPQPQCGLCSALAFVDYVPTKTDVHQLVRTLVEAGSDGSEQCRVAIIR